MPESPYQEALCAAGLLMPDGYFQGNTVWRERGLEAVRLLVEAYVARLREFSSPTVVEHDFLLPDRSYRAVFPDYENVYMVPGLSPDSGGWVLKPDNMVASVRALGGRQSEPIVAVGGLLRRYAGAVEPLFRERYIWPAVQMTQIVPASDCELLLDLHQTALEALMHDLALPVVSVRVEGLSAYGSRCYLTVGCLPDGRPTVLSTSYVMSSRRRSALHARGEVLDVGFTGKLLALVAMHHRDHRGIALPSQLAPVQIAVVGTAESGFAPRWLHELRDVGLRVVPQQENLASVRRRWRAERRWHRSGAPLVITCNGLATGVLTRRLPLDRTPLDRRFGAAKVHAELDGYDVRLRTLTEQRFRRVFTDRRLLRTYCRDCSTSRGLAVFGVVTPHRAGACELCSRPGSVVLVSERGRFY